MAKTIKIIKIMLPGGLIGEKNRACPLKFINSLGNDMQNHFRFSSLGYFLVAHLPIEGIIEEICVSLRSIELDKVFWIKIKNCFVLEKKNEKQGMLTDDVF